MLACPCVAGQLDQARQRAEVQVLERNLELISRFFLTDFRGEAYLLPKLLTLPLPCRRRSLICRHQRVAEGARHNVPILSYSVIDPADKRQ